MTPSPARRADHRSNPLRRGLPQPLKLLAGMLLLLCCLAPKAYADPFISLDSIAKWGKFPKFCVGVYRWGDKFFNTYDSTYVVGTGYLFNGKIIADTWGDYYNFSLLDKKSLEMVSRPSTSTGLYLTYMAVSVGYDINFSKIFGGPREARKRFNFGFNCSLLGVNFMQSSNDVGTHIKKFGKFGKRHSLNLPFNGINNKEWLLDVYYFFNHKRYSQAAAFAYSKIQLKSQGSFYAGLRISYQKYSFDFSDLPFEMKVVLPPSWVNYRYDVKSRIFAARLGYGYNWVFAKNWVLGVSESPILGLRKGYINSDEDKVSFALSNCLRASVVWNNSRWFCGVTGEVNTDLVYDKLHALTSSVYSIEASLGYRFNLW